MLAILKTAYPSAYRDMSPDDARRMVELWASMFSEDDPKTTALAVKACIVENRTSFPPSIGAIKAKLREMTGTKLPSPQEAWDGIWLTLRKHEWKHREAFNDLPPLVRTVVGDSRRLKLWSEMDSRTLETVVASNFQKSYREAAQEKERYDALPQDVKAFYQSIGKVPYADEDAPKEMPAARKTVKILERDGITVAVVMKKG